MPGLHLVWVLSALATVCAGGVGLDQQLVDVADVLSPRLMPGALLMLDNAGLDSASLDNASLDHAGLDNASLDHAGLDNASCSVGRWDDAFATMDFHRKKMNEYLCRSYLAERILNEVEGPPPAPESPAGPPTPPPPVPQPPVTSLPPPLLAPGPDKRSGEPALAKPGAAKKEADRRRQDLLQDEGSSAYKQWLSRTTTLEDVYRHYGEDSGDGQDLQPEADAPLGGGAPAYDGDVTGYAVVGGKMGGASGYGSSGSGYGGGGGPSYHPTGYGGGSGGGSEKAMAIKDLFEMALTAIAFLSFGMFVLNLIMTCFMAQPAGGGSGGVGGVGGVGGGGGGGGGTVTVALPPGFDLGSLGFGGGLPGGGVGVGPGGVGGGLPRPGGRRRRRAASAAGAALAWELNEVSARVLASIDALQRLGGGGGGGGGADVDGARAEACVQRAACRAAQLARSLRSPLRVWAPLWSVGAVWLASRRAAPGRPRAALLRHLEAALLGLGGGACPRLFPDCPPGAAAGARRRRRRGDTGR